MNEWQPMKVRPRKSGFYAINDGISRGTRYAAFDAGAGRWSALRSELSALAEALDECKAELGDCEGWRELTPKEARQVTSPMLDWSDAAGQTVGRSLPRPED
jgi:hypothetical protein